MHLKLVNGQERKYNMGTSTFNEIKQDMIYINQFIEFERSMAGIDDELEDED